MNISDSLTALRTQGPLVLNITNYVVMNTTANALLAIGASPVMAHAIEEIEDLASISGALVINIGTLSTPWIEAMFKAGRRARERGIPVVLDPVGCGATTFRTHTAQALIEEVRPTIIRGNASEIRSLVQRDRSGKGVDSQHRPEEVLDDARALSESAACVVSVSGATDLIVDGAREARVENGHPLMPRVTGMGCTASAITGAFAAACPDRFAAAAHAMGAMGVAGELAGERAAGPGSLQMHFLDALHTLTPEQLAQRVRMSVKAP